MAHPMNPECSCPHDAGTLVRLALEERTPRCEVHHPGDNRSPRMIGEAPAVNLGTSSTLPLNAPLSAYPSLAGWNPTDGPLDAA